MLRHHTIMTYVYILHSVCGRHFYVGLTRDVGSRLAAHNAGQVRHTSKYKPWTVRTYITFSDQERAVAFEAYLKSGSGRAFASRRF